ncbi:MAG: beta-ketoacyl-[acyl-carrier-protein] synthase family protein [Proteobacteria bacterium]|nr:beta-ketoacyl-[acyl-carrier-protein] synthase family protein [Pseudomonadota bacterium]
MKNHLLTDRRRVVITGVGAVTPIGNSMAETWNGIIESRKNVRPISIFDASKFSCNFAYQVEDYQLELRQNVPTGQLPFMNRAARLGWNAADEALVQANIFKDSSINLSRMATCIGVGMGAADLNWYAKIYRQDKLDQDGDLQYYPKHFPSTLAPILSAKIGCTGGNFTVHTACASSGQAIGEAFEMIACGDADIILTGGADSMINAFQVAGFCLLGALSSRKSDPETASRPFDRDREGFVLGEGACMFIFEEYEHAVRRGAKILGEVCGYGVTESAYRITDLHPEGRGTIEAMQMALDDAGIESHQVGYINAHGTSTQLNDRIESLAISKVFPSSKGKTLVSSTKSMTGHLISAAGALEFGIALMSVKNQVVPPSVNLFNIDPNCNIELAPSTATDLTFDYAMSNSIGFGGSNTSVIVRRYIP